jgi:hypothetical protein
MAMPVWAAPLFPSSLQLTTRSVAFGSVFADGHASLGCAIVFKFATAHDAFGCAARSVFRWFGKRREKESVATHWFFRSTELPNYESEAAGHGERWSFLKEID